MENMFAALKETVMFLLGNPGTTLETILTAALSLIVGVLVLGKLGRAMDAKEESLVRSILVLATGVAVVAVGITLSTLFIVPRISPALGKWMGLIVAVVLSLAITVPVCLLVLKQTYISGAITTLLMAAIVAALIYLAGFSHEQIIGAGKTGGEIGGHTKDVQKVMDGE